MLDILACSLAPVRLEKTMLAKRAKTATTTSSSTRVKADCLFERKDPISLSIKVETNPRVGIEHLQFR